MNPVVIALAVFTAILVVLVALRALTANKIDIRNSDVVLALVPVALWLFLTGKIQEFGFGDLKIVLAIKSASNAPVEKQVLRVLPVDAVPLFEKGGTEAIRRAIQNKSQALSFHLGRGGYYLGGAIRAYFDELTQYPYLRYIVLNNKDDAFFGLADARQLAEILRRSERIPQPSATRSAPIPGEQAQLGPRPEPRLTPEHLADWLNANNHDDLKTLPGFIAASDALDFKTDRQKALDQMNTLNVQIIPVVKENKFFGVLDRSKLTATILTDLAAKVNHSQ